MFSRSIRSAIFIDYENVGHRALPDTIPNWIAWLERGEFDKPARRRRKLIQKRVYWNSAADHLRDNFQKAGFTAILCPKFSGLKNGADIKMAMDVVEITRDNPKIGEFILVTKDSDFVPVLQWLRQHKRRTAVLVDPSHPAVFTTYRTHADTVIPVRDFMQATSFAIPMRRRPLRRAAGRIADTTRGLAARLGGKVRRIRIEAANRRAAKRAAAAAAAQEIATAAEQSTCLQQAVDAVIRITSLQPNLATARRAILRELSKIAGFSQTGRNPFCGLNSYRALIEEVAKRTDRIKITDAGSGGISVWYIPRDEE